MNPPLLRHSGQRRVPVVLVHHAKPPFPVYGSSSDQEKSKEELARSDSVQRSIPGLLWRSVRSNYFPDTTRSRLFLFGDGQRSGRDTDVPTLHKKVETHSRNRDGCLQVLVKNIPPLKPRDRVQILRV